MKLTKHLRSRGPFQMLETLAFLPRRFTLHAAYVGQRPLGSSHPLHIYAQCHGTFPVGTNGNPATDQLTSLSTKRTFLKLGRTLVQISPTAEAQR